MPLSVINQSFTEVMKVSKLKLIINNSDMILFEYVGSTGEIEFLLFYIWHDNHCLQ